ncbi:hypothetical protein [Streptococcus sp. DD04]|uniref:hypothetical protein n=1 Tax=Streptococcus sp. DD04 TaxID=1776578 RepID=UPI0007841C3D|nr:hypothetical protein [Streptococcus sp. DD04]KXT67512.1 Phosphoribosylanthranilate isomerase like [Streptococcus sp. DD04]
MTDKFAEFLKIASQLNKMGIIPLLMGSLGLEQVTGQDWQAHDIDIHVHGDECGWEAPDEERIYNMDKIEPMMDRLGYRLVDLHEHEFQKEGLSVEFGVMETLEAFAGVPLEKLTRKEVEDVEFLLPNAEQFLAIYHASSQDSYRNENNNHKDFAKIAYLEKMAK